MAKHFVTTQIPNSIFVHGWFYDLTTRLNASNYCLENRNKDLNQPVQIMYHGSIESSSLNPIMFIAILCNK